MKIHEYQGKKLLKNYGIPIQDGYILENISDAQDIIKKVQTDFKTKDVIVKAQIHAGGRGKGGGVKYSKNYETALKNAKNILGMNLITHQTGPQGKIVNKLFITEAYDIKHEYYVAITLDRLNKSDVIIASSEGGINIEDVAKDTPEKICKVWIKPNEDSLSNESASEIANSLGFSNENSSLQSECIQILKNMYTCYKELDCSMLEINPLVLTDDNKIVALDAKLNFDSNAQFRHPDILKMQDLTEEDPMELEASKYNLNYIKLEGNVGCMVNGAGLAMATMDIIKLSGGEPANFLDVGGAANAETIKNGFKIILNDKNVKSILINIFGGIVRCDRVANGVVDAIKDLGLSVPVIVRLEGTNSDIAKEILVNSGVTVIPANNFKDAAIKAVKAAINEE